MELHKLSVSEKNWDSIANEDDKIPLTDAQQKELDVRLSNFNVDLSSGDSWLKVRERMKSKK